jgi:menaquinone-dependent protoporphyrinogen oxidase
MRQGLGAHLLRARMSDMSRVRMLESWTEGLIRICIGVGLFWIGWVEGGGYGVFLEVVGGIFIAAGIGEVWTVEAATLRDVMTEKTMTNIHPAPVKCDIPVFYATTDGQTRRIAERLVAIFRERGFASRAIDVASSNADWVEWVNVRAAVVGASLHGGRHQRAAAAFVRHHAADLNARPSAFFSVSLAAVSPTPAEREEAAQLASAFPAEAGWHPQKVVCVGGRLAYTQYGFLTGVVMRRIARRRGAPTDTSRDYEFTNWDDVACLADGVIRKVAARTRQAA